MAKQVEDKIAFFVKDQFPAFYDEEGPMFKAFVSAYYEYLEQSETGTIGRNLLEYKDIDTTSAAFLDFFKKQYLDGFPGSFAANTELTLKHILDFYKSKGSPRAVELLFRILFDDEASVAYPSIDVMTTSSADYIRPRYIEVRAPVLTNLISLSGKEITGATSNAKAFVEDIATKLINNIKVHVMYLSNLRGEFVRNEVIAPSDTGVQDDMPIVVGSLSDVEITLGGKDKAVGDIFNIEAASGKSGKVRVAETADATGLINFQLANGGFGFTSNTDFTTIDVNTQLLEVANVINSAQTYSNTTHPTAFDWHEKKIDNAEFFRFETVDQTLESVSFVSGANLNSNVESYVGDDSNLSNPWIQGRDNNNNVIANGHLITPNINGEEGTYVISPTLGTFGDQKTLTYGLATSTHTFQLNEEIHEENLVELSFISKVGTFSTSDVVVGDDSGANGIVAAVNSTVLTVNGSFGSWNANDNVQKVSDSAVTANVVTINVSNTGANAIITNIVSSTSMKIADITGAFNNGLKIKGVRTNAIASLTANPTNSGVSDIYFQGTDTARGVVDLFANVSVTAEVIGSNTTFVGFRKNKYANGSSGNFVANTAAYILGRDSNTYANVVQLGTGSGADFKIGNLENEEDITIYTDFVGENNVSNVAYLDCVIDGGNSGVGFLDTVTINSGGTNYTQGQTITFSLGGPGGGPPSTNATATINSVNGSGAVTSIQVATAGAGFFSNSTPDYSNLSGGSGLDVTGNFDYGYGFPKDPNGDFTTILDNVLTRFSGTVGTVASLSDINPGNNYNFDPFTAVYTKGIAKYLRKDIVVNLDNKQGTFINGENVNQTVALAGQQLNFTSNTGPFTVGEGVRQTISSGNPNVIATGEIYASTLSSISLQNLRLKSEFANGFVTVDGTNTIPFVSNSTVNAIAGSVSAQTAVLATVQTVSQTQTAKGQVYAQTDDSVSLRRLSFSVGFNDAPGSFLFGSTSGANGDITNVYQDEATRPIGDNIKLLANTQAANGIVTKVDILSSGYGYQDGANLTLTDTSGGQIVVSGQANVTTTGIAEGYWKDEASFLNTKYLHDNNYYQSHSYVVESGLSLDKYRDVLLRVAHVSGTKLFGKVTKVSGANVAMQLSNSEVTLL
jgi:hypothetical protein